MTALYPYSGYNAKSTNEVDLYLVNCSWYLKVKYRRTTEPIGYNFFLQCTFPCLNSESSLQHHVLSSAKSFSAPPPLTI